RLNALPGKIRGFEGPSQPIAKVAFVRPSSDHASARLTEKQVPRETGVETILLLDTLRSQHSRSLRSEI
ncbi:MAG: hypothetical protein M3O09_16730, partial [Acidobacteriota bacterium]|nr:hypothetical protein [Acidobacteriota bacterium]